jgi:hypothetical protein
MANAAGVAIGHSSSACKQHRAMTSQKMMVRQAMHRQPANNIVP